MASCNDEESKISWWGLEKGRKSIVKKGESNRLKMRKTPSVNGMKDEWLKS